MFWVEVRVLTARTLSIRSGTLFSFFATSVLHLTSEKSSNGNRVTEVSRYFVSQKTTDNSSSFFAKMRWTQINNIQNRRLDG